MYDGSGSLKSRFLYADARMPVAMEADGQTYYLAYDQVGSLRAVADASGTVVKTVAYDSFGNVLEDSNGSLAVPFGFAGGLYDADTGLVRFGYRDYDAEVGRWTAKDPIGFGGGSHDIYQYCLYNPITLEDFSGLNEEECTGAKCIDKCFDVQNSIDDFGDLVQSWFDEYAKDMRNRIPQDVHNEHTNAMNVAAFGLESLGNMYNGLFWTSSRTTLTVCIITCIFLNAQGDSGTTR